jgi:hypothetical protein
MSGRQRRRHCALGNGWLWEHGTITDLITLVASSALHLTEAHLINDRGEIAVTAVRPSGEQGDALLVPAQLAALEWLASNAPAPGAVAPATTPRTSPASCAGLPVWRALLVHRLHHSCFGG